MPRAKNKSTTSKKDKGRPTLISQVDRPSPKERTNKSSKPAKKQIIESSPDHKLQSEAMASDNTSSKPVETRSLNIDGASPLRWRAYEFYYHQKSFGWYLLAILGAIVISALAWVISGFDDYISSGVILIALLGLLTYAGRKPDKKDYEIDAAGLKVNNQFFSFEMFRHFWIEIFETHAEVTLVGLKKTTPPITLYIKDRELASHVMDRIGTNLPEDTPSRNPFDWLTRKIKF